MIFSVIVVLLCVGTAGNIDCEWIDGYECFIGDKTDFASFDRFALVQTQWKEGKNVVLIKFNGQDSFNKRKLFSARDSSMNTESGDQKQ